MENKVLERFLRYVKYDTVSDYNSTSCPSTASQMLFAEVLARECKSVGFDRVTLDENGYIYCFLKGNLDMPCSVGFIAHMDTSPDFCGGGVEPKIVREYDGSDITLNAGIIISPSEFPFLTDYVGNDIVTADGHTLLGADDKAGIAEILTAVEYLIESGVKRPDIFAAFTPDEEIGRGMDKFNLDLFTPEYAFTIDGGMIGELEYESFNAARAAITIKGVSVHPGYAKGVMKNSAFIACEFLSELPQKEIPALTDGYEGFYHIISINANVESAKISMIIRDFTKDGFADRKKLLQDITDKINIKYGNIVTLSIKDEYYNMGEVISSHMPLINAVADVYRNTGIEPVIKPIRGGTDGSRLSFMGIPCPNIFAGGHNFHGPYELIPVQSMVKAIRVILGIVEKFGEIAEDAKPS